MTKFAPVGAGLLIAASSFVFAADGQPKPAQVEPMSQDRFSEIHAPLFQTPKSKDASALTERIAASLPGGKTDLSRLPRKNFIHEQIFGNTDPHRGAHTGLDGPN